jgi:hypothetical protein
LDETRLFYERQFQQYLATEAAQGGFTVVDLLQEWPDRDNIFADPSHLNRFGAAEVATRIANDPNIPWRIFDDSTAPTAADSDDAESAPATPEENEAEADDAAGETASPEADSGSDR